MDITTWEVMVLNEPLLQALEEDVQAFARTTTIESEDELDRIWYRLIKPRLVALVGWEARLGCLQSTAAYDVAYRRLYDRLMGACDRAVEAVR